MALLVQAGLPVLPVGVAEPDGRLRVSCGPLFVPEIPQKRTERERVVAQRVMAAIKSANQQIGKSANQQIANRR
jgi:hypothetical protein